MQVTIDDPRIADEDRRKVVEGCEADDVFGVLVEMMRSGLKPHEVLDIVSDQANAISRHLYADTSHFKKQMELAVKRSERCILGRKSWVDNALKFREMEMPYLLHHLDEFYSYRDGAYESHTNGWMNGKARQFLARAYCIVMVEGKDGKLIKREEKFNPASKDVRELISALKDLLNVDKMEPPCWLDPEGMPPVNECISLRNGILHWPTRQRMDPTPLFFTLSALKFDYDPEAKCPLWERTLAEWWPPVDGQLAGEVTLLQEMFGLFITTDTRFQKLFVITGDGGTGKGTLARTLHGLLGEGNYATPSLKTLEGQFGLQNLIGKLVAIISETQFGRNADKVAVTGTLKQISGEDHIDVNRKNLSQVTIKLLIRILMLCNKIPNFVEDSDALARRLIALNMRQSFKTNPNGKLSDQLREELPGILNWSLDGLDRLMRNGRFSETDDSREASEQFLRASSTVRSFIDDCCLVDDVAVKDKRVVTEDDLHGAYKVWCQQEGCHYDSKTDFISSVLAYDSSRVRGYRPDVRGPDGNVVKGPNGRPLRGARMFRGIGLAPVSGRNPGRSAGRGLDAAQQGQFGGDHVPF